MSRVIVLVTFLTLNAVNVFAAEKTREIRWIINHYPQTYFVEAAKKMNDVFEIVLKAQQEALKFAKPGVSFESVDAVARKVISDAGYGPGYKYFTHRLGHGIGMDGHEWYYVVGGNKRLMEKGNMMSNEPGIYLLGEFGIRIEDEMLITENGAKLLLPKQKSLEVMFNN